MVRKRESLQNVLRKELIDFLMARYRLRNACLSILIPIKFAAVPDENTSGLIEHANQVSPLHPTDNSATLRIAGISPLVRSR